MRARSHGIQPATAQRLALRRAANFSAKSAAHSGFGFMFPSLASDSNAKLPEGRQTVDALRVLGKAMATDPSNAESNIPAAYTYFGQFVDHDITKTDFLIPINLGQPDLEPLLDTDISSAIRNLRTPHLDLESVYEGFDEFADVGGGFNLDGTMKIGDVVEAGFGSIATNDREHDLPRRPKVNKPITEQTEQEKINDRRAIVGDERNDENLLVAQMHVAFLRSHNVLIKKRGMNRSAAQAAMRRRYQWAVLHDFLKRVCLPQVIDDVLENGPKFFKVDEASSLLMPVEFSGAAFRFGHSMVRQSYRHNATFDPTDFNNLFTFTALSGNIFPADFPSIEFDRLPDNWIIEWHRFFSRQDNLSDAGQNPARRIDTHIAPELAMLRNESGEILTELMGELTTRNLLRGYLLGLPTGQSVAELIGTPSVSKETLLAAAPPSARESMVAAGFDVRTPLWFYVLAEAGDPLGPNGNSLGSVGSRIVAETLWNMVFHASDSVLKTPPSEAELSTGEFTLRGIINIGLDGGLPPI